MMSLTGGKNILSSELHEMDEESTMILENLLQSEHDPLTHDRGFSLIDRYLDEHMKISIVEVGLRVEIFRCQPLLASFATLR